MSSPLVSCVTVAPGADEGRRSSFRDNVRWMLLCSFVFWSQFKPSEPFLVEYLAQSYGLTNRQVVQEVFPLFAYSHLPSICLVACLSELAWFGTYGLLLLGAAFGLTTACITRFVTALWAQQMAQFLLAFNFASRIAVEATVFQIADPSWAQQGIHTAKAVLLLSNCCSALLGEMLRDGQQVPLVKLFSISVFSQALTLLSIVLLIAMSVRSPEATVCLRRRAPSATPPALALEEAAPAHPLPGGPRELRRWVCGRGAPLRDLWCSLRLRTVAWWTLASPALNSVHSQTMTYWQTLLREKHLVHDHNGYFLAALYLSSAALVAVVRGWTLLRGATSPLVLFAMAVSGVLLYSLACTTGQLSFYVCIMLFSCVFHMKTTVGTFQTGAAVIAASELGEDGREHHAQLPCRARLTLVYCTSNLLSSIAEMGVQTAAQSWDSVSQRFSAFGIALMSLAVLFGLVRFFEACHNTVRPTGCPDRQPQAAADGGAVDNHMEAAQPKS